jgi:pyruvate/2-oxoglutarate dehydrogenase complex dihydrolipoamide dehydrogenase (E3) component
VAQRNTLAFSLSKRDSSTYRKSLLGGTCVNNGSAPTKLIAPVESGFSWRRNGNRKPAGAKQILKNKSKKRYFSKWFP